MTFSCRLTLLLLTAIATIGCTAAEPQTAGGVVSSTDSAEPASSTPAWFDPSWPPPPPRPDPPPVDPTVTPISRASATAEAKQALEVCGALERDSPAIDRMGLIPVAAVAPEYVRVTAAAPQLTTNALSPAWVIEFRGERPDPMAGQSWIDATCIVIDGEPVFYATGPVRDLETGRIERGYYPSKPPPQKSLPAVLP